MRVKQNLGAKALALECRVNLTKGCELNYTRGLPYVFGVTANANAVIIEKS